ncbi:hypothetical protein J7E63_26750 [Bacillus sp. ISL-75]|uniref:hypothetical protein n=1 Tax=Bacillus sp. ISL-75 TaxID=2819137 RepID=UPI001BEB3018|nr:hypothetical protein [Bacillus sp. ISL-75]MBT2730434.1 hypothetical protein [Bacillus sp. ISL-75]
MNSLTLKSLFIFEPKNKVAKRIDFEVGINIITSDKVKGNDVGKSILLKSIYHTLGADCIFDDKWKESPKIYIIHIAINEKAYYIYRSDKLFKVYSNDFDKLFSTINRMELAEYLKDLYGFSVKLPNKKTEELEIVPPVYSYLLNYVDQDRMEGPKFNSFGSLFQYKNDKNEILFNHFGIFTDEYFKTIERIEKLKKEEKELSNESVVINNMLKRVRGYLDGKDAPADIETLKVELEENKKEYTDIVVSLNTYKNKLMNLRNERIKLENDIKELQKWKTMKENDVKIVNDNFCPTCSQEIDDIGLKISQSSQLEDFYIMKNQLDSLLLDVERKLKQNEDHYAGLLKRLNKFEEEMNINNTQISDVLKHRGYLETQNNMLKESGVVQQNLSINAEQMKESKKTLKKYDDLKKEANELYEQLMIESINLFGLKEIALDKFKKLNGSFSSRGSNVPITTIIWYFNLLKVKFKLNPDAIRFPLVLDSPNNVELDDDKQKALFDYIFTNNNDDTQLIVSTLGFNKNDYQNVEFNNIIDLEVRKYNLLNKNDYEKNKDILNIIFVDE